jgi:hypothetical protein
MKKGDLVKIKPECCLADESPSQLYVVVQEEIEKFGNDEAIDCQFITPNLNFPVVNKIQKSHLSVFMTKEELKEYIDKICKENPVEFRYIDKICKENPVEFRFNETPYKR